nr:hypothetical protein [Tanacetum cinerariifolium]
MSSNQVLKSWLKETSTLGEIVSLEKSNKNVIGLKDVIDLPVNVSLVIVIVSKLFKWRKSRSRGLKGLMKIGSGRRVKSLLEKDSLGAQEDASKQGRMIEEIDQDDEIVLDADTQGRKNNSEMFGVDDLSGKVVLDTTTVTTVADKVSAAPSIDVTKNEITMAQALAALKSTKPKVVVQEQELEAGEQEITRLGGAQQDEEANISWDIIQAMMEADSLLAEMLQAREREEFSEEQKGRLEIRKVNNFIAMDSEAQKRCRKEAQESDTKRIVDSLEPDIYKKQKVDENVEPVIDDTKELKKCMETVPDDGDEVLIEATPLFSRSPTIIDYKIYKEGNKT